MRSTRRRHRPDTNAELNITAFMNLMVVLIPFLLLTAVFSQVSILKLDLPAGESAPQEDQKEVMQLEVLIREDKLVLAERKAGVIAQFPSDQAQLAESLLKLNALLQEIKSRDQENRAISILAEPDTSYDLIVQTMDAVRVFFPDATDTSIIAELFPDISIGSAPPTGGQ